MFIFNLRFKLLTLWLISNCEYELLLVVSARYPDFRLHIKIGQFLRCGQSSCTALILTLFYDFFTNFFFKDFRFWHIFITWFFFSSFGWALKDVGCLYLCSYPSELAKLEIVEYIGMQWIDCQVGSEKIFLHRKVSEQGIYKVCGL